MFYRSDLHQIFERAVHCARKNQKKLQENRTCSHRFLQSFCTRQARCECATHAEVSFDVMKVTLGISAVCECDLWLFPHIFGAKLRRFRWKIIVERFDLPLIESIELSNLLQSNYSIGVFHIFGFIKENISFAGPSVAVFIEGKQTFDASL